jgi:hypothetical protein
MADGESADADIEKAEDFIANVLPGLIEGYAAEDIYNADETGVLMICCNVMVCDGNMTGTDKFKLLVIGKSQKPRCFKNVKFLPVQYFANKKAWMTSVLFETWLLKLDARLKAEKAERYT